MSKTDRGALRRMFVHLAELAEDASLTGKFRDGAPDAVRKYNALLNLVHDDDLPNGLFEPLPIDAGWDRLGVDARLLAGYLEDERKGRHGHHPGETAAALGSLVALAPFLNSEDLARLIEERIAEGLAFDEGSLIALAPFVGSDALGRLMRNRLRRERTPKAPEAPVAPQAPVPPDVIPVPDRDPVDDLEAEAARHVRRDEPDLETLLSSLRNPTLDSDQRQVILDQIAVVMATKHD